MMTTLVDVKLLENVIEHIPAMVFMKRASDLRFVMINRAGERLLGFSRMELLGKSDYDFFPAAQADAFTSRDRRVLEISGYEDIPEEPIDTKTHGRRILHTQKVALIGADGRAEFLLGISEDITERKQAQDRLIRSEYLLAEAQRQAEIGAWELDLATQCVWWSDEQYRINGVEKNDVPLTQNDFMRLVHPDDRTPIEIAFSKIVTTGKSDMVYRIVRPDGAVRFLHGTATLRNDALGRPARLLGMNQDITERVRMENELRDSEERYRSVVASMSEGVVVQQQDGQIIACNAAAEDILGLTVDQMRGRTAMDPRWRSIHEDGSPFPGTEHPGTVSLRTGQIFRDVVMGVEHPGKGLRWISINSRPLLNEGTKQPYGSVASFTDITERKSAQKHISDQARLLDLVFQHALDCMVLLDKDYGFIRVNTAYARVCQRDPSEFPGRNHFELYPSDLREEFEQAKKAKTVYRCSARPFTFPDHPEWGTTYWDLGLVPILDSDGEIELFLFTLKDVTEQVRTFQNLQRSEQQLKDFNESLETRVRERTRELQRAKDDAERANRAKSDFLSRMSHELRTPMNAILGFAQVLEEELIPEEARGFSAEIHRAGEHLLELINELLDLARIEVGKLSVVLQRVPVRRAVEEAATMIQPLLATKNIVLSNHCVENGLVMADPTRLRQILFNILSNAVKYNRDRGRIDIQCGIHSDGFCDVAITDTGLGIAADKLDKVFEPFERLGAQFGGIDGAGIGLTISSQLAQLMGGSIRVESREGHGSTFHVLLPQAHLLDDTPVAAGAREAPSARPITVLYVEDNAANLRVIEAMFRKRPNLKLITAMHGRYGLELAERYLPDVIMLDIHLPELNGFEVLAALRANPATRAIPAIALSADAMPIDIERGLAAGFVRYLAKPIKVAALLEALQIAVDKND